MAKQRTIQEWFSLSEDYRNRLERNGQKGAWLRRENISAARGHGKTPEHPREAVRRPEKYPEYTAKREPLFWAARNNVWQKIGPGGDTFGLIADIADTSGAEHAYNSFTVDKSLNKMSLKKLERVANGTRDELLEMANENEDEDPLWYH